MACDETGAQLFKDTAGRLYLIFGDSLEGYRVPDERWHEMEAHLRRNKAAFLPVLAAERKGWNRLHATTIGSLQPCSERTPAARSAA